MTSIWCNTTAAIPSQTKQVERGLAVPSEDVSRYVYTSNGARFLIADRNFNLLRAQSVNKCEQIWFLCEIYICCEQILYANLCVWKSCRNSEISAVSKSCKSNFFSQWMWFLWANFMNDFILKAILFNCKNFWRCQQHNNQGGKSSFAPATIERRWFPCRPVRTFASFTTQPVLPDIPGTCSRL